jgi:hypothetical protein
MKSLKSVVLLTLLALTPHVNAASIQTEKPIDIVVYRTPSCGCCEKWLAHLQQNNFNIKDIVTPDVQAIKTKYAISSAQASCHTALVEGYVIEGHVPAQDIKTLLTTKADLIGLAVPKMPIGTPGMEMGDKKQAYDVIGLGKHNASVVFNHYDAD